MRSVLMKLIYSDRVAPLNCFSVPVPIWTALQEVAMRVPPNCVGISSVNKVCLTHMAALIKRSNDYVEGRHCGAGRDYKAKVRCSGHRPNRATVALSAPSIWSTTTTFHHSPKRGCVFRGVARQKRGVRRGHRRRS